MFRVAGHLSSLRMASLVGGSGRRENKVAKDRPVRGREKGNKDPGFCLGQYKRGAMAIGDLPLMYRGCGVFEWVPVMNVSGGQQPVVISGLASLSEPPVGSKSWITPNT